MSNSSASSTSSSASSMKEILEDPERQRECRDCSRTGQPKASKKYSISKQRPSVSSVSASSTSTQQRKVSEEDVVSPFDSAATTAQPQPGNPHLLKEGAIVTILGLKNKQHLNGHKGIIRGESEETKGHRHSPAYKEKFRWSVEVL